MFKHEIYTQCDQSAGILAMWDGAQTTWYNLNDDSTMYVITMVRRYSHHKMVQTLAETNLVWEEVLTNKLK